LPLFCDGDLEINHVTLKLEADRDIPKMYPQTENKVARTVVLNLFHCWDPLNATDVVWDPQVKIEKVCAPE